MRTRLIIALVASSLPLVVAVGPVGAALGPAAQVSTEATQLTLGSGPPVTATARNGPQLVVWSAGGDGGGDRSLLGRVLQADGQTMGPIVQISEQAPADDALESLYPTVSARGGPGGFLVAWCECSLASGGRGILARRVGPEGELPSEQIVVAADSDFDRLGTLSSAYDSRRDEFLVVWGGVRGGGDYQVYGASLAGGGGSASAALQVSPRRLDGNRRAGHSPTVAYDTREGRFFVAWAGGLSTSPYKEVYARLVPSLNKEAFGATRKLTGFNVTSGGSLNPTLAYNRKAREYAVAWRVERNRSIYARRSRSDGRPVGSKVKVGVLGFGSVGDIQAAPNGDYLIGFERGGRGLSGALARRVGPSLRSGSEKTISGRGAAQATAPTLAYSRKREKFLAVWAETDSLGDDADYDVYARSL